ncbi:adenosylcobinamide-phosphate synthase CbiB [Paenibacillus alkaliterrae]|uniref:adenosylcobinamide-phosphate synthase CbiB n=1 Tax=Paenibacillus alkaliterrae TaxID=320909 RepID=UPI001F329D65|nr:adenosylcobinamide-phosphate synthase CbiB [Paenibacillus alkaliterrae]MCF2937115.1 adenosylcobinamide-phosphate synthase CbiB [Paenibacillus alkaliterrae]
MMLYSFQELLLLAAAAIVIDWIVGDPKRPTHPVIWIGRLIRLLERVLAPERRKDCTAAVRLLGVILTAITLCISYGVMWSMVWAADAVHVWLGYAVSAWFISTTIAVKGLKEAAMLVYTPLSEGRLAEARKFVGFIVGRDTGKLDAREASRAAVETVAENIVDALVSPVIFALIGGAPLAMLYRAANTLDSMVGYRNDTYRYFGWCSARIDDVLNYIPARLTGVMLTMAVLASPGMKAGRAVHAMFVFARLHPSPNSGIPESAVAGALGIELGGTNVYFGVPGERARMGWPLRRLQPFDIVRTIRLLYGVSFIMFSGVMAVWLVII